MTMNALEMLNGHLSTHSNMPKEIFTGTGADPRPRLRVDVAQTSFWEGREFRHVQEFSIAQGATLVLRFICDIDFIVFLQRISIDAGAIRFSSVNSGGTAGGSWTSQVVMPKNQMSLPNRAAYTGHLTIDAGGTYTGGTERDVMRLRTDTQGNSQASIGVTADDARGVGAGTYYVRLQNIGSGTSTGVYYIDWEERP